MLKITLKIIDPAGLHARPASIVASTASKFDSKITLSSGGKSADLKSIMNVMALGVKQGAEVEISAEGPDAEEAIKMIGEAMKENKLV